MNSRLPIAYVDLDETSCKFKKAHKEHLDECPEIGYPQSQVDFFRKLEPIEGAIEGIKALAEAGYDVWILTRPSIDNPMCYMEKRLWVEDHLGLDWCHKLIISPDKTLSIGDFLIDDYNWQGEEFENGGFQGEQLIFGSEKYPDWKSVLKYLIDEKNS